MGQLSFNFALLGRSSTYHVNARVECIETCISCDEEFVVQARVSNDGLELEHSKACRGCLESAARDRKVSAFRAAAARRGKKPLTARAAKRMARKARVAS